MRSIQFFIISFLALISLNAQARTSVWVNENISFQEPLETQPVAKESPYLYVEDSSPLAKSNAPRFSYLEIRPKDPNARSILLVNLKEHERNRIAKMLRSGQYVLKISKSRPVDYRLTYRIHKKGEANTASRFSTFRQSDIRFYTEPAREVSVIDVRTGRKTPLQTLLLVQWPREKRLQTGQYGIHQFERAVDWMNKDGIYRMRSKTMESDSSNKVLDTGNETAAEPASPSVGSAKISQP